MAKKRKKGAGKPARKPGEPRTPADASARVEATPRARAARGDICVRAHAARRDDMPQPRRDEPAFWFGFEVSWAKLALGRVRAVRPARARRAPADPPRAALRRRRLQRRADPAARRARPGAHRIRASASSLLAYLFMLAAFGVATRWLVPLAAAIYAWLYFGSQLDSYQHHYLVCARAAARVLRAVAAPARRDAPTTRVATVGAAADPRPARASSTCGPRSRR